MTMPNSMGNPADGCPPAPLAGQGSVERGSGLIAIAIKRALDRCVGSCQGSLIRPGSIDGPIINRIAWLRQQRPENLP
jgi:hypothetical protein